MNWNTISQEENLSFAFLKENEEHISWLQLSLSFPLTKELFETFPAKLDTEAILVNPSFTIDLLEEVKDIPMAICWDIFSRHYPIDKEIYERFKREIYVDELMKNNVRKIDVVEKVVTYKDGRKRVVHTVKDRDFSTGIFGSIEWEPGKMQLISGYAGKGKSRLF